MAHMRYVHILLGLLMTAFAAVQYNDPDALLWIVIYLIPAAWAFAAAFRAAKLRSLAAERLLWATVAIGVGLAVSLLFSELFGLAAGGMVVPGYFAIHLTQPLAVVLTLAAALVTYWLVYALSMVVIIYGNYPHIFGNVVVNNPIKRHVADFWSFHHDIVEYDERWNGIGRIFVVNVDARRDRYDGVLRELASARAPFHLITRVSARLIDPGALGGSGGQAACLVDDVIERAAPFRPAAERHDAVGARLVAAVDDRQPGADGR